MKLPFDFATKLVLRLVLPGAILCATLWPVIMFVLRAFQIPTSFPVTATIAIMVFGWIVLLLDMPIYMLFEGRRFWPPPIRRWRTRREAARLDRLESKSASKQIFSERLELDLQTRFFPLNKSGNPEARYPTRLGNLLMAFEEYPLYKYGIDGTFGWPRLWVSIDKDLRSELDDQQAVADSGVYVACILFFAAICCSMYAVLRYVAAESFPEIPSVPVLAIIAALCIIVGYSIYRLSLFRQAQYGELFTALFDQNVDKFTWNEVIDDVRDHMKDTATALGSNRERHRAAVRFLKWHQYRRTGTQTNETVTDY